ncbi:hypothetical protein SLEP1_g44364 [Rubroshorea leprosula]|uniref:RING-CH-type domain-containing protein n=1 Tax=Rubroshorea leprosula TaxID=152421 RepID=A0AAV5LGD9_9ROSI|nr:hypothetical protein SLEP1_g44364 [Rubroshorea leprosula]
MVDDFMVCIDRIIATACFESVNNGGRGTEGDCERQSGRNVEAKTADSVVSVKKNSEGEEGCSSNKVMTEMNECRICQEEADTREMEAPCACNGTLKFAHRKCIQRWCNKKGDITCEICKQVFSPNYSLPPARSNPDVMAIDIRQAWGSHVDLRDSRLLVLTASESQLLQSEYEDYVAVNSGSLACLRAVALILLIILLVHQFLLVTRDSSMVQESSAFYNFQVSFLQFAGFLLPCYVMARTWYLQSRRRRQG